MRLEDWLTIEARRLTNFLRSTHVISEDESVEFFVSQLRPPQDREQGGETLTPG